MIQYPKNVHTTLPSIEGGLGSMNILRDPPKSIQTYFREKVEDTNLITKWLTDDESKTRICENILPYGRGINQFVNISYDNYSNNGGVYRQMVGNNSSNDNQTLSSSRPNASLPYKVNYNFRPDTFQTRNLLPLSTLPRLSYQTAPSDEKRFFDSLATCGGGQGVDLKAVRNDLLQVCCNTRSTLNIETPQAKPQEIIKSINPNKINANAVATQIKPTTYLQVNKKPTKGLQNIQQNAVTSNICDTKQVAAPIDFRGNQKMPIKDLTTIPCQTNIKLIGESQNINNTNISLERNNPLTSYMINPGNKNIDINSSIQSRNAYLPQRTFRGGFDNAGNAPSTTIKENYASRKNANKNTYREASSLSEQRSEMFKPFK